MTANRWDARDGVHTSLDDGVAEEDGVDRGQRPPYSQGREDPISNPGGYRDEGKKTGDWLSGDQIGDPGNRNENTNWERRKCRAGDLRGGEWSTRG